MKKVIMLLVLVSMMMFGCSKTDKEQTITNDTTKKSVKDLVTVPQSVKNPNFVTGKECYNRNDYRTALEYFQKVPIGDNDYVSVTAYINICKDRLGILPLKLILPDTTKIRKQLDSLKLKAQKPKL